MFDARMYEKVCCEQKLPNGPTVSFAAWTTCIHVLLFYIEHISFSDLDEFLA